MLSPQSSPWLGPPPCRSPLLCKPRAISDTRVRPTTTTGRLSRSLGMITRMLRKYRVLVFQTNAKKMFNFWNLFCKRMRSVVGNWFILATGFETGCKVDAEYFQQFILATGVGTGCKVNVQCLEKVSKTNGIRSMLISCSGAGNVYDLLTSVKCFTWVFGTALGDKKSKACANEWKLV